MAITQSNDTPSNNLAVFDSADTIGSTTPALSEGNIKFTGADNGGRYISGFPFTTGKFYWELDVVDAGASFYPGFFTPAGIAFSSSTPWNNNAGSFVIAPAAGHWLGTNGDGTANITNNYTAFIGDGDRMFFAYDADNKFAYVGEVGSGGSGSTLNYYSLGGAVTGDPTSGASGTGAAPFGLHLTGEQTFYFGIVSGGTDVIANLIADPTKFNGTPPTGYVALTQDNMDNTSDKITAWSWIKNRDATDNHMHFDRIRGIGKDIHTNATAAEATDQNTLQRFLQRGAQVGNNVEVNTVNESYVLWQWLLGDSATTGSTNTAGSVDTTVIAADAGHFSIVKGTTGGSGATFGHGLGAAPDLIINKDLNNASSNWLVYNSISGATFYLALNLTNSIFGPGSTVFGTEPDANVFTLGSFFANVECINYCFRSVPGVCKVGSYTGNNNADGTYVHTGFKPAWIITKTTAATGAWGILDNKRDIDNPVQQRLFANANSTEDTDGEQMDFLSDGFKLRKTGGFNNDGQLYVYMAMAEIGGNGTLPPIYGR